MCETAKRAVKTEKKAAERCENRSGTELRPPLATVWGGWILQLLEQGGVRNASKILRALECFSVIKCCESYVKC